MKDLAGRSHRLVGCTMLAVLLAGVLAASADSRVGSVRGRLDLTKCKKPCNDTKPFVFSECAHWNPPGNDSCQTNVCLETTFYYTECERRTFTSDPTDCVMVDQQNAPLGNQQARSTANLTCTDNGWVVVQGYPADTDCRSGTGAQGKCFIGTCPGVDVDEYPVAPGSPTKQKYSPTRTWDRKVCG